MAVLQLSRLRRAAKETGRKRSFYIELRENDSAINATETRSEVSGCKEWLISHSRGSDSRKQVDVSGVGVFPHSCRVPTKRKRPSPRRSS